MARMKRLGFLGLTHDHVWHNMDALKAFTDIEYACAADPNQPLLDQISKDLGIPQSSLYRDYREMLEKEQLDGVLIYAGNHLHAELVEAAAAKGLHCMVEKPMARSSVECDRMINACKKAGVRLMINFPIMWNPDLRNVVDLIKSGAIGRLWMVKYRDGHMGPKELGCSDYFCDWLYDQKMNGGGAMADFCVYGANVTAYLLGRPTRITGAKANLVKTDLKVEDNGVIIANFEDKEAMAIIEGTWSQMAQGNSLGFFGTTGTIATNAFQPREWFLNTKGEGLQQLKAQPLPEEENRMIKYFVRRVRNDQPFDYFVEAEHARMAQEYVEMAFKSIEAGGPVTLD